MPDLHFLRPQTSPSAAKALEHLNSLPFGIRAKPTKTKEQKAKEEENRRQTCELMRSCGYKHVRDNPSDMGILFCSHCGREEKNFEIRRCLGCEKAAYCSKACQSKDWPEHKLDCDEVLEKLRKKKEAEKAAAAKRFDAAVFKAFPNAEEALTSGRNALVSLAPPPSGTIWGVVDPELFGVIPDAIDDPLDYQLLHSYIKDFVESKSVFGMVENPRVGELVIAVCREEEAHGRAVVTEIQQVTQANVESAVEATASVEEESPVSNEELQSVDPSGKDISSSADASSLQDSLVNLWFIDLGVFQAKTSVKALIPVRDFWDELKRLQKRRSNGFLNATHFVDLPARLIPCFLHATDPDTGQILRNRAYRNAKR